MPWTSKVTFVLVGLIALGTVIWTAYPAIYRAVSGCPLQREVARVSDEVALYAWAKLCEDTEMRRNIVEKLTAPDILKEIVLTRPRWVWQPGNPMIWPNGIRSVALSKLRDQRVLEELASREHEVVEIKLEAIRRLERQQVLQELAFDRSRPGDLALSRLNEHDRVATVLVRRLKRRGEPKHEELAALDRLTEDRQLAAIALADQNGALGEVAARRITDQVWLKRVAAEAPWLGTRYAAGLRLTDPRWIVDVIVVRGAKGFASCSDEISEIADPVLLADLVIRASANKHHRAPISASFRRVPGCRRVPDPSSFVNDLLIETREDRSLGEIVKHAKRFKLRSKALDEIYRKDVLEEIEAALNDQPIEEALTGPERERELLVDHVRRGLAALAALDKLRQGEETTHEEGWAAIRGLQHEVRRSGRPPDYEGLLRQILSRHADKKMLDMYLNANDTMEQLARSYAKFNGWTILERRVVK